MKHEHKRVALDTETIVSGLILPISVPADALRKAFLECDVFVSTETWGELQNVLCRPKLDRYFDSRTLTREQFLEFYRAKMIV